MASALYQKQQGRGFDSGNQLLRLPNSYLSESLSLEKIMWFCAVYLTKLCKSGESSLNKEFEFCGEILCPGFYSIDKYVEIYIRC